MAGRGRGRGPALSFDLQALGIAKGDIISETVNEPPPLYPPLRVKPMQPIDNEQIRYMVKIKERMQKWNRENIIIDEPEENPIEKYSDKYKVQKKSKYVEIEPYFFPAELFEDGDDEKKRKRLAKKVPPKMLPRKKGKQTDDSIKKLDESKDGAKLDDDDDDEQEKVTEETKKPHQEGSDDDNSDSQNEIELDSEQEIEETDYAENYFDNGESYIEEDDNLDDE